MCMRSNVSFTVTVSGGGDTVEWACVPCGHHIQNEQVEQRTCIRFCIKFEHSSVETVRMIQKATAMGNCDWQLHHNNTATHMSRLRQSFLVKHQITQVTQPPYCPDVAPCNYWLFPKLKSPVKGKRFQTMDEIQENMTGQLMAIGRTVWGPKVPTLKGTEASLSYVQCFSHLVSSSVNISIFHIPWLDTFWTDLVYLKCCK